MREKDHEAIRLAKQLKKIFGDDMVAATSPDDLSGTLAENAGVMILTMDAGNIGQAKDMANAANDAVARNPKIKFMFGINNVAKDAREVDQIPAARLSLRTLFMTLRRPAFHRFHVEHQCLMLVAVNAGRRFGEKLVVPPWMVSDPNA